MRAVLVFSLLACCTAATAQHDQGVQSPAVPLVVTDAIALPLSSSQIFQAAQRVWPWTFGRESGARLVQEDTAATRIQGGARINFRSKGLGSREESMGVINYQVFIQAENGQCRVRISHFTHTGNRNATGGGVDLGLLYAGQRPQESVQGISMGTANRLHADMRAQSRAHMDEVIKTFFAALRRTVVQQR